MPIVTEEEIKTLVDAGEEGGVIQEEEKEMIYSIFEYGDTVAREVMVPRMDVLAIDVETPLLDAMDAVIHHAHSRVPVYQGSIDNVAGILYAKDLLKVLHERGRAGANEVRVADILRPAAFTPESKKVNELFEEMQKRRIHMAIVIDEYGDTVAREVMVPVPIDWILFVLAGSLVWRAIGGFRAGQTVESPHKPHPTA